MVDRRLVPGLALALALVGCGPSGPPAIRAGTPCDGCGMEIHDLRFACARQAGRAWRRYDAIECLLREGRESAALRAWLTDYDAVTLHAADSVWVVQGSFPSPMGGGFAAFESRDAADRVAAATAGRVAPLRSFLNTPEAK